MKGNRTIHQFAGKLILLTVFLYIILFSITFLFPGIAIPSTAPLLYLFFLMVTLGVHYMLLNADKRSDQQFIRMFMLATMLKLFLYISFVLLLIYLNRDEAKGIAIIFMVLYVFYSGFEILSMLAYLKSGKMQKDNQN